MLADAFIKGAKAKGNSIKKFNTVENLFINVLHVILVGVKELPVHLKIDLLN